MSAGWIDASAVLSTTHAAEFEATYEAVVDPCDITIDPHPFLRVRLSNTADEVLLMLALTRCGQEYWVGPRKYEFPIEWETEVREIVAYHCLRASVVPSVCYRLEVRNASLLDDLRGALFERAPTFGPTYPRIAAA